MPRKTIAFLIAGLAAVVLLACSWQPKQVITNPITPGYFADPCIVRDQGVFYIYATIDPWGGKELGVLETRDFIHFTQRHLGWPTKEACTSPTASNSMVWAPSVVRGPDGKYYMYVAVGSEIWAGVSDKPLGPWKNLKVDGTPLIRASDFPRVHNIDADCFIDDDGQAYLYWGSGFQWVNGHCMAVKLNKDMHTFEGAPVEVTTPHYFEAVHMMKHAGRYYLMFSEGKAIDATYRIGYATGDSPLGPFTEPAARVILATTPDSSIIGPGHNTTFVYGGQTYILYHRILPQKKAYVLRQLCLDSLNFNADGTIRPVSGTGVARFLP